MKPSTETADCTVRITATAHRRLKQAAKWADETSLANAARFAIDDWWRRQGELREIQREAHKASKARRDKAWKEGR